MENPIYLETTTGRIAGTLVGPPNSKCQPVILIVAGSGPTDRHGVGESLKATTIEADLRFENYVDDAIQWLKLLSNEARFSHVSVIGHSEGALIGMMAAKAHRVRSLISIASPAQNGAAILRTQLASQLTGALLKRSEAILDSLDPLDDEKQSSSYDDPSLPIAPDLINTLITFLSELR